MEMSDRPAAGEAKPPLFALGQIVATPGARRLLQAYDLSPIQFLARHVRGDWGVVDPADARSNDQALVDGGRLLSAYRLPGGEKLWIISECDRSATTLLLPEEY